MPGPAPSDTRKAARATLLAGLALLLATLLAHLPALRGGWLWDDDTLVRNALVRSPGGLPGIWAGRAPLEYLPATTSLYWLEFRLWGDSATGFHAVTVLLHAAAALAAWRLLVAWSALLAGARGAPADGPTGGAWWGALLFAVHPLTVASVAWVAETKNVLSLLLALLACRAWVAWLQCGCRRALGLGVLAFTLALLAKTALVALPAVLLLMAWWHGRAASRRSALRRDDVLASAPFFAASLVLGLVTVHFQHSRALGAGLAGSESLALRLVAAGRAVWWYAGKALAPFDLTVVYARWPVDPGQSVAWLPLAGLLAALAWWLRSRHAALRAAGAGLLAFSLLLLPALGLVEMAYMAIARVSDHFAYPALLVPCALLGFAGEAVAAQARRRGDAGLGRSLAVLGAVVALALGAASFQRAGLYRSQAALFGDNVARVPDAWLAQNNLGAALLAGGDVAGAEPHLRAAIALHPGYGEPRANLGALLLDAGRLDEARASLEQAVAIAPELPGAHGNLGRLELEQGHLDAAVAALQRSLALEPAQPELLDRLGVAFAVRASPGTGGGEPDNVRAERAFRGALELRPDFPEALNDLARLLLDRAVAAPAPAAAAPLLDEAERCLRRALELKPDYAKARGNLAAVVAARRGR